MNGRGTTYFLFFIIIFLSIQFQPSTPNLRETLLWIAERGTAPKQLAESSEIG